MSTTRPERRRRGVARFARQLLAASVLVTAVGFLGVAIEHSALAQVVAPHFGGPERLQVVTRGGHAFVKVEIGSPGHQKFRLDRVPNFVTGIHRGHEIVIDRGPGSPPDFSSWMPVAQIFVLVVAIAMCIAGLDQLRRSARRRRRARAHSS